MKRDVFKNSVKHNSHASQSCGLPSPRISWGNGAQSVRTNPATQKRAGTGPLKFGEWKRGASIRLVRKPNYWDAEKPFLEEISFQIIPQGTNRVPALQTGEIDERLDFYTP